MDPAAPATPSGGPPPGNGDSFNAFVYVLWTTAYLDVASAALIVYDAFLTLELEIRLVWRGRWGLPAALYILNRYGVMLQACLNLVSVLNYSLDLSSCESWNLFSNWSIPIVMMIVEATLALRVVVLWGNKPFITTIVWVSWLGASIAMLALMGLTLQGSFGLPSPDPPILGCQIGGPMVNYWSIYIPSLCFETFVALLTFWKALQHRSLLDSSPLLHVLIRDGFVYFFIVLALMLIALLGTVLAPLMYSSWFPQMSITIASMTAVRLFLHLRQVAADRAQAPDSMTAPSDFPSFRLATTEGSDRWDQGESREDAD